MNIWFRHEGDRPFFELGLKTFRRSDVTSGRLFFGKIKLMKKLQVFILILAGLGAYLYRFNQPVLAELNSKINFSYCDSPIHYRVDTVDPQFGVIRDVFVADVSQAAQIWDKAEGKDLFVYDPKGDLSVNLVYDERQSLNNQVNSLQDQLNTEKSNLGPEEVQYKQEAADFESKLSQFGKDVEYWNSQGGAPPDEYQKLKQEQSDLQAEADQLNSLAKSLNLSADQYNVSVNKLNQAVDNFNQVLSQKPEEGLFDGRADIITIYFDNNQPELIHTLAHELGHSLGINHNQNPQSIMYPYSSKVTTLSADDLASLSQICQRHDIFALYYQKVSELLSAYFQGPVK